MVESSRNTTRMGFSSRGSTMVPLKDVSCFEAVPFRVPAFWTWQRKGKLWGFWRNDESPDADTGCLWVAYEVIEVDRGSPGRPAGVCALHPGRRRGRRAAPVPSLGTPRFRGRPPDIGVLQLRHCARPS